MKINIHDDLTNPARSLVLGDPMPDGMIPSAIPGDERAPWAAVATALDRWEAVTLWAALSRRFMRSGHALGSPMNLSPEAALEVVLYVIADMEEAHTPAARRGASALCRPA